MNYFIRIITMTSLIGGLLSACGGETNSANSSNPAMAQSLHAAVTAVDIASTAAAVPEVSSLSAGIANASGMGVAAAASTTQWTFCAQENGRCIFTGTQTVRYGAGDRYVSKNLDFSAGCNNATFGDPAPGVAKHCEVTSSWTRCANEGGTCTYSGTQTVRYGSGNNFFTKTADTTLACNNNVFGDPTPTVVKQCDRTPTTWTLCAAEGGRCNFSGANIVLYGANGNYYTHSGTDGLDCNNAVFGDPASGSAKSCYLPGVPIADGGVATPGDPSIASIQLAQSQLFNASDSALVLIRNKAVLVKVNAVTNNAGASKPSGKLQIKDANGNLVREINLSTPGGALPASVPEVPDLNTAYGAIIPADLVIPGLRITASLSNGQTSTLNPRVGGGVPMNLITIPVQIAGSVGHVVDNLGAFVQDRIPVSNVQQSAHGTYVSSRVTTLPTTEDQWSDAFGKILGEIADLHTLEGANDLQHYFGFIPKPTYGLAGLGYVPGTAAVAADIPSLNLDGLRTIVTHELGHNYRLAHAACGGAGTPDPAYPYPNAQLGTGSHYTWGYLFSSNAFFDPRSPDTHDIMSYCGGSTFSDYNTHLMQAFLTPADALVLNAINTKTQNLVLVSGQISGEQAKLFPLKSYLGRARRSPTGEYTLRIVTAQATLEYPFSTLEIDHAENLTWKNFSLTIPDPGPIVSVSVSKGKSTLLAAAALPQAPTITGNATVQVAELNGKLALHWDQLRYPYLTVTVVTDTERITLAQDLKNGSAILPLDAALSGASFEFSLSDGINSTLVSNARSSVQNQAQ